MFFLSCSYLTDTENGPLNCWIRTTTEQVSLGGHGSTHDLRLLGAYKWRWPMYKLTKNKHLLYINGCCSLSYTNEDWAALCQTKGRGQCMYPKGVNIFNVAHKIYMPCDTCTGSHKCSRYIPSWQNHWEKFTGNKSLQISKILLEACVWHRIRALNW